MNYRGGRVRPANIKLIIWIDVIIKAGSCAPGGVCPANSLCDGGGPSGFDEQA